MTKASPLGAIAANEYYNRDADMKIYSELVGDVIPFDARVCTRMKAGGLNEFPSGYLARVFLANYDRLTQVGALDSL